MPPLRLRRNEKLLGYGMLCGMGIMFGLNIIPLGIAIDTYREKKYRVSTFNRTAASFQGINSVQKFARYNNTKQRIINLFHRQYLSGALMAFVCSVIAGSFYCQYKKTKNSLIIYKRYKKSLKIKQLIQQSIPIISIAHVKSVA